MFEAGENTDVSRRINQHGDTFLMLAHPADRTDRFEFSIDNDYEMYVANNLGIIACLDHQANGVKYVDALTKNRDIIDGESKRRAGLNPIHTAKMWLEGEPPRDTYEWGMVTNHGMTTFRYTHEPGKFTVTRPLDRELVVAHMPTKGIPVLLEAMNSAVAGTSEEYYESSRTVEEALKVAWI